MFLLRKKDMLTDLTKRFSLIDLQTFLITLYLIILPTPLYNILFTVMPTCRALIVFQSTHIIVSFQTGGDICLLSNTSTRFLQMC